MATWNEVREFLGENFKQDIGMQAISGAGSYAADVEANGSSATILIFDSSPLIQVTGFIGHENQINLEKLIKNLNIFGLKNANGTYALQHIGIMESLDSIELLAPIRLMAGEIVELKGKLGLS